MLNFSYIDDLYRDDIDPEESGSKIMDGFYKSEWGKQKKFNDYTFEQDQEEDFEYPFLMEDSWGEHVEDDYFNEFETPETMERIKMKREKYKNMNNKKEHFGEVDFEDENDIKCKKILKHIKMCSKCREKVLEMYGGGMSFGDDLSDIVVYILTGVFIIFLLDFFFKWGMKYGT